MDWVKRNLRSVPASGQTPQQPRRLAGCGCTDCILGHLLRNRIGGHANSTGRFAALRRRQHTRASDGFPAEPAMALGTAHRGGHHRNAVNYYLGLHFGSGFLSFRTLLALQQKAPGQNAAVLCQVWRQDDHIGPVHSDHSLSRVRGRMGKMEYRRFALYNVTGGVVWVTAFLLLSFSVAITNR